MERIAGMIELETQTADFYQAYARMLKDDSITKVFGEIADNARNHAVMLRKLAGSDEAPEAAGELGESLFKCLEGCGCIKLRAEELAAYVACSDLERELITRYDELKKVSGDGRINEISDHISKDHKETLFMLTDMIEFLNRSSDWVESAEFTLREPY